MSLARRRRPGKRPGTVEELDSAHGNAAEEPGETRSHRRLPVPASIASYIKLVLDHAGQQASSIWRGQDAAAMLHAHGNQTEAEINVIRRRMSNPAGRSQRELFS